MLALFLIGAAYLGAAAISAAVGGIGTVDGVVLRARCPEGFWTITGTTAALGACAVGIAIAG